MKLIPRFPPRKRGGGGGGGGEGGAMTTATGATTSAATAGCRRGGGGGGGVHRRAVRGRRGSVNKGTARHRWWVVGADDRRWRTPLPSCSMRRWRRRRPPPPMPAPFHRLGRRLRSSCCRGTRPASSSAASPACGLTTGRFAWHDRAIGDQPLQRGRQGPLEEGTRRRRRRRLGWGGGGVTSPPPPVEATDGGGDALPTPPSTAIKMYVFENNTFSS